MEFATNAIEKQRVCLGCLSGELADCGSEPHYSEDGGVTADCLFIQPWEDL